MCALGTGRKAECRFPARVRSRHRVEGRCPAHVLWAQGAGQVPIPSALRAQGGG